MEYQTHSTIGHQRETMEAGLDLFAQTAAYVSIGSALGWALLLLRWETFSLFSWTPLAFELALAQWPTFLASFIYGSLLVVDAAVGIGLLRDKKWAAWLGIGRGIVVVAGSVVYFYLTREFYGAAIILAIAGMILVLITRNAPWSLSYPAAFWLAIFFLAPMIIVFIVSLGERSRLGTVTYPAFDLTELAVYFDDYGRFFSRINGQLIYLRIFWRSAWLATLNTVICLLFGYPFAYWIARQSARYRGILIFLVMIPFWTNFLVRTYAWMLILRDSGIINNFWTITLHDLVIQVADKAAFFAWLASLTEQKLPLLFNQSAVFMGLFYGYIPFMILPLYSSLEKMDWSLLEAAADLGANTWKSTMRVLLPMTMPGIVAGSIIVFIPSLGAYVTPDLLGGGKVALLGNLLQQQFMTVRDWPFGSAISFIMMALMLLAVMIYFRTLDTSGDHVD